MNNRLVFGFGVCLAGGLIVNQVVKTIARDALVATPDVLICETRPGPGYVTGTFMLTNNSGEVATVTDVSSSCACESVSVGGSELIPGTVLDAGESIALRVAVPRGDRRLAHAITIVTDKGVIDLKMCTEVVWPVSASPSSFPLGSKLVGGAQLLDVRLENCTAETVQMLLVTPAHDVIGLPETIELSPGEAHSVEFVVDFGDALGMFNRRIEYVDRQGCKVASWLIDALVVEG